VNDGWGDEGSSVGLFVGESDGSGEGKRDGVNDGWVDAVGARVKLGLRLLFAPSTETQAMMPMATSTTNNKTSCMRQSFNRDTNVTLVAIIIGRGPSSSPWFASDSSSCTGAAETTKSFAASSVLSRL
jgi:hypothetical protein